jgi:hypothetical protein
MSVDLRVFRDLQALSAAAAAEIAETIKVAAPLKRALAPDTPDTEIPTARVFRSARKVVCWADEAAVRS